MAILTKQIGVFLLGLGVLGVYFVGALHDVSILALSPLMVVFCLCIVWLGLSGGAKS